MRSKSGIFVAPDRRISSCVITKIAAAACDSFCSFLETEVTWIFIRSSSETSERSRGAADCAADGAGDCEDCAHTSPTRNVRLRPNSPAIQAGETHERIALLIVDTVFSTAPK